MTESTRTETATMVEIRRTDDARLLVSNNRHSRVVDSESDARRTLHSWGHTDISINKALTELRRAEGSGGPAHAWRVVRPAAATPESTAREPVAATPPPPKRARKPRKAPTQPTEPEPVAAAAAAAADMPEEKPRAPRKRAAKQAAASAPAPAAEPAPKKPRAPRKRAATPDDAPAPAPAKEATSAPARKRAPKRTAPASTAATGADPRTRAVELAAQLTDALRELENETLPFARAPWADLRGKAEFIAACLRGKKPPARGAGE